MVSKFTEAQICNTFTVSELVKNGDFELGYLKPGKNVSIHDFGASSEFEFYSDLNFVGLEADLTSSSCNYGIGDKYAVIRSENFTCAGTNYINNAFFGLSYGGDANFNDHTPGKTGKGYALVVDVNSISTSVKSGGDPIIWEQKIKVNENMTYYFSTYVKNYSSGTPVVLNMVVVPCSNGTAVEGQRSLVGSGSPSGLAIWNQVSGSWNAPALSDSVFIRVEVGNPLAGSSGNDFVLDDISFINSCQNIEGQISKFYDVREDTLELCANGGIVNVYAEDQDSYLFVPGTGRKLHWYVGEGTIQVEIDSLLDKHLPQFRTSGSYRMCVADSGSNTCGINKSFYVHEKLTVDLPDVILCDSSVKRLSTVVIGGSQAVEKPQWILPSGQITNAYEIYASETGQYTFTASAINGYKCKTTNTFNVTSNIAQASLDTVLYCTNGYNLNVSSKNGDDYIWGYDKELNNVAGTGSTLFMPEIPSTEYDIYFKPSASSALGTIGPDTTALISNWGLSQETLSVSGAGVELKELKVKYATWSGGCSGSGSTIQTHLIVEGSKRDTINFTAKCGYSTLVPVNLKLPVGSYTISLASGVQAFSKYGFQNQIIDGFVIQTGEANKIFSDMVFEKGYTCASGKLRAIGWECTVTGIENEADKGFNVYPNPTSGMISIVPVQESIEILSMEGKVVAFYTNASVIDLSALLPGVYFVKSSNKVIEKLVIR